MNYYYRRGDKTIFQIVLLVLVLSFYAGDSSADHGLSLDGTLNYKKEFDLFDWVSVEAVKGGELILHAIGSYDKITPVSPQRWRPGRTLLFF